MGVEIAPRFARRLRAAEHRHRLEEAEAFIRAIVGQQELAAPKRAVVAEAECRRATTPSDGRSVERIAVFGQAGGDVGVMVLHLDERDRLPRRRGRGRAWTTDTPDAVGDERRGRMIEQLRVKREAAAVVVERLRVLEVALMLRQDRLAVLDEAERRLELAAHRQELAAPPRSRGGSASGAGA